MKELKSNIRKHEKALQQIINRYYEKYTNKVIKFIIIIIQSGMIKPILKQIYTNGPLINVLTGIKYYTFILKIITIKIKKESEFNIN